MFSVTKTLAIVTTVLAIGLVMPGTVFAQTGQLSIVNGRIDFGGAAHTSTIQVGTSLPATCTVGELYFKSNASAGQNIYECQSTNTWTQQSGGGGGGGGVGNSTTNTTPVTVSANTTGDQKLIELSLAAGYLNSSGQPFMFNAAGVFTTPIAQTPTLTFKIKLCTVSGCGSGTVVTLVSLATTAVPASSTNNPWNFSAMGYTATTGATGNLEIHGPVAVDLGAATTSANSVFSDTNTAVSSNIDLTAALFVDFTVATSTGSTSNSITQRVGGVMPFGAPTTPTTNQNIRQIGATFVNGGSALSGSTTTCGYLAYAGTIQQVTLIADVSGSVTVDVKTVAYSSYTGPASASSITASAIPALSSAVKAEDTTLVGWTKSIAADTVVCFALSSPTTVASVQIELKIAAN